MVKYVPFLKAKAGELKAIELTSDHIKKDIKPLFQILPPSSKTEMEKSLDDYLSSKAKAISLAWSLGNPVFIDRSYIKTDYHIDGVHFITRFFELLRAEGINPVPVVEIGHKVDFLEAVKIISNEGETGCAIRIRGNHIHLLTLEQTLNALLANLSLRSEIVDLVIDLEYISGLKPKHFAGTIATFLKETENRYKWRSVVVCSGSFPLHLGEIKAGEIRRIPRLESLLFEMVRKSLSEYSPLIYGDYCNVHPIFDPTAVGYQASCSIKYSDKSNFVILRGEKPSRNALGNGQYNQKAQSLISMIEYKGQGFSFGDEFVKRCAGGGRPGNAKSWVTAMINHHIAMIHSIM